MRQLLYSLLLVLILSCGKNPNSPLPVPERPETPPSQPQPIPTSAPSPTPTPEVGDPFTVMDPVSGGTIKGTISKTGVVSISAYEGNFETTLFLGGTQWANPFSDDPDASKDPASDKTCEGLAIWSRASGNSDLPTSDRRIAREWLRNSFPVPVTTQIPLLRGLHPAFLKTLQALVEQSKGPFNVELKLDDEVLERVDYAVHGNRTSLTLIGLEAEEVVQQFFEPFRNVGGRLHQETRKRDILCDLKKGSLKATMSFSYIREFKRKYADWTIHSFRPELLK